MTGRFLRARQWQSVTIRHPQNFILCCTQCTTNGALPEATISPRRASLFLTQPVICLLNESKTTAHFATEAKHLAVYSTPAVSSGASICCPRTVRVVREQHVLPLCQRSTTYCSKLTSLSPYSPCSFWQTDVRLRQPNHRLLVNCPIQVLLPVNSSLFKLVQVLLSQSCCMPLEGISVAVWVQNHEGPLQSSGAAAGNHKTTSLSCTLAGRLFSFSSTKHTFWRLHINVHQSDYFLWWRQ